MTDFIYHVGSTLEYRSISEGCLVVGGIGVRQERQTCFFTAVYPINIPLVTPLFTGNEPRMIPYRLKWRRMHDPMYGFDLNPARDKGVVFWQTITKRDHTAMQCHQIFW